MYAEGHIPGAVSLPYGAFKEKAPSVLPADKGAPVVFYCAGET
jgi:rhodanese-related sulfurtransferase